MQKIDSKLVCVWLTQAHPNESGCHSVQERWQLQQEGGKLKAQQAAFEEERTVSLRRTEEEKDHLQIARVSRIHQS